MGGVIIHHLYLGTWFPRASMHMWEVFHFLHQRKPIYGLDQQKVSQLHSALNVQSTQLHEEHYFDYVLAQLDEKEFLFTDDGIMLLKDNCSLKAYNKEFIERRKKLSDFYLQKLGPAIDYLFSRGAPIPRKLEELETVTPYIVVVSQATPEDIAGLYKAVNEEDVSFVESDDFDVHHSASLVVLASKKRAPHFEKIEAFIRHDVFFHKVELQLEDYLSLHRTYWDDISTIRETRNLRAKDFPTFRKKLMDIRSSIVYVSARLEQMNDIRNERSKTISAAEREVLQRLGFHQFDSLESSINYMRRLWNMNLEQLDGTVTLFTTLYEENTQRELAVLKTLTIATVVTGFFGMNIAFPWDKEWAILQQHSYVVAVIVIIGSIVASIIFHYLLRNRVFEITGRKIKETDKAVS